MNFDNNTIFIIIAVVFLIWVFMYKNNEPFDSKSVEFVNVGDKRYGIRGDELRTYDIARNFIQPNRNIIINPTSGMMWESNNPPCKEGIHDCNKVACPNNLNDFDNDDTCWQCGTFERKPIMIPDLWPH